MNTFLETAEKGRESVCIAIPATGRMAGECLEKLAGYQILNQEVGIRLKEAIGTVRKQATEITVREAVSSCWVGGLEGITLKYDLRSGFRAALSAIITDTQSGKFLVYGSEPPTISGIFQGLSDIAYIGFDDLLAAMIPYVKSGDVRDWSSLNNAIEPQNATDVRVIGPAGLDDYAGLFLLAPENLAFSSAFRQDIVEGKTPVYVKGRNQGLAYYLLGQGVDARPAEAIEEAVWAEGCFGLDLVQSGRTVLEEKLLVVGKPLLATRCLVAADITRYSKSDAVRETALRLTATSRPDSEDKNKWLTALSQTLGSAWVMPYGN